MPIVTDYIPLAKAAEQLECTEGDLLQLGLLGEAQLMAFISTNLKWELRDPEEFYSVPYANPIYGLLYPGFYPINSDDCANLMVKDGKVQFMAFNDIKVISSNGKEFLNYCGFSCPEGHNNTFVWVNVIKNDPSEELEYPIVTRDNIYIFRDELIRLISGEPGGPGLAPVLNKKIRHDSKETFSLMIATMADMIKSKGGPGLSTQDGLAKAIAGHAKKLGLEAAMSTSNLTKRLSEASKALADCTKASK